MNPDTQDPKEPITPKRDHRQEVTDSLVELLEKGVAPWQKPWQPGALQMPFNPTTNNPYRGGNTLHLMSVATREGYEDPRWLSYKQALANGWQVRKGEKGTQIEYWDFPQRQSAAENLKEGDPASSRPIHRVYTVFNAKQIEGVPEYVPKRREAWEVVQSGEQILRASGAEILHDQNDRAFYNRAVDRIHLPPKAGFPSPADYYGTALHELAHWSGHPTRLDRQTLSESYRFGDTNYAKEELRAELTSLFLAAGQGIPHNPERHAAYVGSWIQALKDDKHEIFRAAKDANRAADFLLALERDKSVAQALESAKPMNGRTRSEPAEQSARVAGVAKDALSQSFAQAKAFSQKALGPNSKTRIAQTDSGIYRGQIIDETAHHVVQQISPETTIAHMKQLLGGAPPQVGQHVVVAYSNSHARVTSFEPKAKVQQMER